MSQQTIDNGSTPGDGTGDTLYTAFGKVNGNFDELYAADGALDSRVDALEAAPSATTIVPPQGRLTLTSNTPVMTANTTAQSTVYYAPFRGKYVPIYSGATWAMAAFSQISLALNTSDNLSGSLYDVFVFDNSGTLTLGTGPAWSSGTARGTGAGTTELERKDGIWTNKVSITLKAGGSTVGTPAGNRATYLGTIYCTANGQTGFSPMTTGASGGAESFCALFNAYNRVPVQMKERDTATSWTYNSVTWRAANNSNANRISWLDGLQEIAPQAALQQYVAPAANNGHAIGIYVDATSGTPGEIAQSDNGSGANAMTISTRTVSAPLLGKHFFQAAEACSQAVSHSVFGGALYQFTAQIEM